MAPAIPDRRPRRRASVLGTLRVLTVFSALVLAADAARATSSSTVWTPLSPDIQPFGVCHVGVDNYFTVFTDAADGAGDFPTDAGLTVGILPFEKLQMEVGVDLLEPSDDPLVFNAKMGAPEGALFSGAPALQVGIANAGTEEDVTDYDIVYLVVGKTIPGLGRLSGGPYTGNSKLLVDADGEEENDGFMVAFDRGFLPVQDAAGEFNRLVLAADYASGDNALGGVGLGLYYYFHRNVSVLTGPVWFNEEAINGEWKWTIQLDVNLPKLGR